MRHCVIRTGELRCFRVRTSENRRIHIVDPGYGSRQTRFRPQQEQPQPVTVNVSCGETRKGVRKFPGKVPGQMQVYCI